MHSEYRSLRSAGAFSIGDPEAGRKLTENLDRRRVRLQIVEMCWHFGIPSPDGEDRQRVKAFLDDLCRRGDLVEPVSGLYCRPDMTEGRASVGDAIDKLAALHTRAAAMAAVANSVPRRSPGRPRKIEGEARRERVTPEATSDRPRKRTTRMAPQGAGPATDPPKPKSRAFPDMRRQSEWILRWLRSQGGSAARPLMRAASLVAGIVAAQPDIEVPLQLLLNRNRVYLKDGLLTLTLFGEQEAAYLDLRREALEAPVTRGA